MAAKSGESKTGLIVFLVLFILLSIGLGVFTYLGYDGQKALETKAAEATKSAKDWENDANWYRFVADTYRLYIGQPIGDDVAAMRGQYNDGGGALFTATRDKFKDEHRKLIAELDAKKKWDAALKKPANTYQDEVEGLRKELANAQKAAQDATSRAAEMEALADTRKKEREDAEKNYKTELGRVRKLIEDTVAQKDQMIAKLQEDLSAAGEASKKGLAPLVEENAKLRSEGKKSNTELKAALQTIKDRGIEASRQQAVAEIDVTKFSPENLATIRKINASGDTVYIALGSEDNVKPQVTFSVYGKGPDGRPLKEPKGKIEVTRVVSEHVSLARVTEVRDSKRDPILPGDFLYNPAWNANLKQHVAVIGTIDLTGEGRDQMQEFLRTLQRQNVAVDAWMDMRTLKLNGEITRQTDLLILGASPDFGSGPLRSGDPKVDAKTDAVKAMQKVQDDAEKLGVRIIRLNNYVEMSGYPLPKTVDRSKIEFQRNLPAAGSPVERRETPPK